MFLRKHNNVSPDHDNSSPNHNYLRKKYHHDASYFMSGRRCPMS
jgi:hypothetical protein